MSKKKAINDFIYEGLKFHPTKTLRGKESDFIVISKRISNIGITLPNWNYKEFHKIAKENGAGNIDLFEMNGIAVIPATNYLFQYQ